MILSAQTIIQRNLVTPCRDELVQGASIDCTLYKSLKTFGVKPGEYVDCATCLSPLDEEPSEYFLLEPKCFALAATQEVIKVPYDLVGFCAGKSSLARQGLQVEAAGLVDPGFEGQVVLELFNMSPWALKLYVGMPICQMYFSQLDASTEKPYQSKGHYQGQRGVQPANSNLMY